MSRSQADHGSAPGHSSAESVDGRRLVRDLLDLVEELPARLNGRSVPPVVAITASAETLWLLLGEQRTDAPSGFEVVDDGRTWMIDRSAVRRRVVAAPSPGLPWPLLATLGDYPPQGSVVLANLEELGVIRATGAPEAVAALLESVAAEVAESPLAEGPGIICVGCGHSLRDLPGVQVVERLSEVLADVEQHAVLMRTVAADPAALSEMRMNDPTRRHRPMLVLDPHTRDSEMLDHLHGLAAPGLAMITAATRSDPPPRRLSGRSAGTVPWTLEIDGGRLYWEPVGVELQRSDPLPLWGSLPAPARQAVSSGDGAVAGVAAAGAGTPRRWRTRGLTPLRPGTAGTAWADDLRTLSLYATAPGVMAGPVELRVLGVVHAVGTASAFTSQRALDLACYLAFHRDGATADHLKSWLWDWDALPTHKSFANVVSRARICLGRDADGDPYLSHLSAAALYRLSGKVTTDLERFAAWLRVADQVQPPQALACLREALSLVRGAPFSGGNGATFSWTDNTLRGHVEYLVDSTAHRLTDAALDAGRIDIARWAIRRGLVVTPGCEQCYRRKLLAARRSGSRREMYKVMRDMHRFDAEPVAGFGDSPATGHDLQVLYDDLLR